MKNLISFTLVLLLSPICAQAQQYAGKFKHKPALSEFEQFIVMHDAVGSHHEDALSVKAFGNQGELWHSVAYHPSQVVVDEIVNNFKADVHIISVYKLEVSIRRENLHYYLLGYRSNVGLEEFLVIEEFYHGPEDLVDVEVNSFGLPNATARNH